MDKLEIIDNSIYLDNRGYNSKIYSYDLYKSKGINFIPVEILLIHSNKFVLRGFHFQKKYRQRRVITCNSGSLYVVVVGIDRNKDSFGKQQKILLSSNNKSLFIPSEFALATLALENAEFTCLCADNPFMNSYSSGINWKDGYLDIDWPIPEELVIASDGDNNLPGFIELMKEQY